MMSFGLGIYKLIAQRMLAKPRTSLAQDLLSTVEFEEEVLPTFPRPLQAEFTHFRLLWDYTIQHRYFIFHLNATSSPPYFEFIPDRWKDFFCAVELLEATYNTEAGYFCLFSNLTHHRNVYQMWLSFLKEKEPTTYQQTLHQCLQLVLQDEILVVLEQLFVKDWEHCLKAITIENGQIIALDLSLKGLTSLPPLDSLARLQSLDLRRNQLQTIPETLGQLTQPTVLDLSYNQLQTVPEILGQLTQLILLFLRGNQLQTIPETLGQLTQLRRLDLRGNQLRSLPESVKKLAAH